MPAAYVPTAEDVITVALFLFSVAASPLPDGFADAACFQIDRADLWKIASTAKLPMGRNNFNRVVLTVAALGDAVTVDRAVGSNRHFVRFAVPEADDYVTVHLLVQDARVLAAMPESQRPLDGEIATPTDIAVTPAHAAAIDALPVDEVCAYVVDHLEDRVLCVIREDDEDFLAAPCPEFTAIRRMLLRADSTCTICPT